MDVCMMYGFITSDAHLHISFVCVCGSRREIACSELFMIGRKKYLL